MFTRVRQPTSLGCGAACGGGVREGTVWLATLSARLQSLPLLPTSKLGPSGADSRVGGLVYDLGPCGSPTNTPVRLGVSPAAASTPMCFQSGLRLYFPALELWVARSVSLPSCSSRFICTRMWDRLLHQLPPLVSSSRCPSPPLLQVDECFFNSLVVRLPYSLIFCQFWFFFVFKLLLSFFWLCKEAVSTYLQLGRKLNIQG